MMRSSLGLVVLVLLAGCMDVRNAMQRFTPTEAESAAHHMLELASAGDVDGMLGLLDSEVRGPEARQGLKQIVSVVGGQRPQDLELINSEVVLTNGRRLQYLVYEGQLGDQWILAQFRLVRRGEVYVPTGFFVNVHPESQRVLNGFWANVQPLQAVWLLLAVGSLGVIGLAVVRVVRSGVRRKWLWIFVSAIALVRLSMNWTTAQVSIQPIAFQLFGVGVQRTGLYGPWTLTWALPIGALWILWRIRRIRGDQVSDSDGLNQQQVGVSSATPHGV